MYYDDTVNIFTKTFRAISGSIFVTGKSFERATEIQKKKKTKRYVAAGVHHGLKGKIRFSQIFYFFCRTNSVRFVKFFGCSLSSPKTCSDVYECETDALNDFVQCVRSSWSFLELFLELFIRWSPINCCRSKSYGLAQTQKSIVNRRTAYFHVSTRCTFARVRKMFTNGKYSHFIHERFFWFSKGIYLYRYLWMLNESSTKIEYLFIDI